MLNPFRRPGQSGFKRRLPTSLPAKNRVIYGEIAMIWQENMENTKNSRHISSQSVNISARDNTVLDKTVESKNNSLHISLPTITRSLQTTRGRAYPVTLFAWMRLLRPRMRASRSNMWREFYILSTFIWTAIPIFRGISRLCAPASVLWTAATLRQRRLRILPRPITLNSRISRPLPSAVAALALPAQSKRAVLCSR